MEFTVYRKYWVRGSMLNELGQMCCLGHRQVATGETPTLNRGMPSNSIHSDNLEKWEGLVFHDRGGAERNTDLCIDIAITNDSTMKDNVREGQLKKLFSKVGDTVTFSSDEPPQEWLDIKDGKK